MFLEPGGPADMQTVGAPPIAPLSPVALAEIHNLGWDRELQTAKAPPIMGGVPIAVGGLAEMQRVGCPRLPMLKGADGVAVEVVGGQDVLSTVVLEELLL